MDFLNLEFWPIMADQILIAQNSGPKIQAGLERDIEKKKNLHPSDYPLQ
jgi:hypothetical protein